MRSQSRSAVGWILAPTCLAAALWLSGGAAAGARTGRSPDCKRFCMSVEPRVGPEDSVFRFSGRGWRPRRRVEVTYLPYCRPDEACIAVIYIGRLRTSRDGRFTFRLRAGRERRGDDERKIHAGARPSFSQWLGKPNESRRVTRTPRYRVDLAR